MKFRRFITAVSLGVLGPAMGLLLPTRALADTCNGFITISYPNGSSAKIGDDVLTRISVGTGSIDGGTILTLKNFFFDRACSVDAQPLSPFGAGMNLDGSPKGCVPDPAKIPGFPVAFDGIVPNSAQCFNVQLPPIPDIVSNADGSLFTAQAAQGGLKLPPNLGPFICRVDFNQKVTGLSGDSTPKVIEQLVGYHGALCDNDTNRLDSGNFQTAAINIIQEENFDCYQVTGGLTPPPPLNVVSLVDQFTDTNPTLSVEHRVCTGAEVADVAASGDHFTGYGIKKGGGNPNADVTVLNPITGSLSGHVGKAVRLLVPATKALGKGIDPGPPTDTRHFQCYQFDPAVPVGDFMETLTDQFILASPKLPGTATVKFPKSFLLCPRVDKNGEDPGAPNDTDALLCFQRVKNIQGLAQNIKASTRDQFQNDQNLSVSEFQEFCVSSTIQ